MYRLSRHIQQTKFINFPYNFIQILFFNSSVHPSVPYSMVISRRRLSQEQYNDPFNTIQSFEMVGLQDNPEYLIHQSDELNYDPNQSCKIELINLIQDQLAFEQVQRYLKCYESNQLIQDCFKNEISQLILDQYQPLLSQSLIEDSQIQRSQEKDEIKFYIRQIRQKDHKDFAGIYEYGREYPQLQRHYHQLIFQNHFSIIKYLSSKRQHLSNVAQYYFEAKKVKKQQIDNTDWYQQFQLKIEKGNNSFKFDQNRNNQKYINLLWNQGFLQVLKWIRCLISGIIQLQKMGIFHTDLQLRNTIKTESLYKIIDFDYAFKVQLAENQRKSQLKNTLYFFQQWLSQDQQLRRKGHIINFMFREINEYKYKYQNVGKIYQQIFIIERSGEEAKKKAKKLTQLLKQYMLFHHCQKVKILFEQIFKYRKGFEKNREILLDRIKRVNIQDLQQNIRDYSLILVIINDFQSHKVN